MYADYNYFDLYCAFRLHSDYTLYSDSTSDLIQHSISGADPGIFKRLAPYMNNEKLGVGGSTPN